MGAIDTIRSVIYRFKPNYTLYAPMSSVSLWKQVWQRYCAEQSLRRSREALRTMSDAQLRDIGITRADAEAELHKSNSWS